VDSADRTFSVRRNTNRRWQRDKRRANVKESCIQTSS
jgi:hypothetical protein